MGKESISNTFDLSERIAYKGKIGRKREAYCLRYTKQKKEVFEQIYRAITKEINEKGTTITCKKGCSFSSCCMEYVDATIQECETIVYFLYKNKAALKLFLQNYPEWRNKVKNVQNIEKFVNDNWLSPVGKQKAVEKMGQEYYELKAICPFLDNNLCKIYEVRPYVCAGYYVTSPIEQCDPDYKGYVPVTKPLPPFEMTNQEFYYHKLQKPRLLCMPLAVHEILEKGYYYLDTLPGLNGLANEAIREKKVRNLYKK